MAVLKFFIAPALVTIALTSQQRPDPDFDVSVAAPAYVATHPRVVIDEAHNNFHTADGRYKPFATLLRNDGYDVRPGRRRSRPQAWPASTSW